MSNNNKNNTSTKLSTGLVPKLRFPEFKDCGEWEEKPLKMVSEIIMGSSPSSSSYNDNKIGLPLLQGNADIKNRLSAPRIYTSAVTKKCEIGDILLSVRAPVGTVAKSLHKACIGRGIAALRAIDKNSQEYLYQWLFSYESFWQKISQGGTFDAVNSDDIRNLYVPIPTLPEQQKIAACLSSLDEVITAEQQKLEQLKQHKKGLLQNLFPQEGETTPKLRFPEFKDSGEWDYVNGDKLFEQITNKNHNSDLPILAITQNQGAIPRDMIDYHVSVTDKSIKSYKVVEIGDFIISLRSFQGGIEYSNYKGLCSPAYIILRKKINVENEFFKHYFKSVSFIRDLNKNLEGIRDGKMVSYKQFSDIFIPFPTLPEQQKIAACLSSLDELIDAQSKKIELLQQHKKGLLQGLFPDITNYENG